MLAFALGGLLGLLATSVANAAAIWPVLRLSEVGLGGIQILDRHGAPLYDFASSTGGFRDPVPLEQISPHLVHATIATEDHDFYTNPGLNFRGLLRAGYENLAFWKYGGFFRGSGGSSITQQVVKNLQGRSSANRSPLAKVNEMIAAVALTRLHSKDEILSWYLNSVFYGSAAFGAQAAAERYFGKPASELDVAEAAFLAGIPNAPGYYDVSDNFEAVKERQWQVLQRMAHEGYITPEEAEAAYQERLELRSADLEMKAPHFVMYVRGLLPRLIGEEAAKAGVRVTTTLDLDLQTKAEQIVEAHVRSLPRSLGDPDAALVAIDPRSGEVLAMVGGRHFYDDPVAGQVNNALALNSPGSAIKPITYLAAFQKGWAPATVLPDAPIRLLDANNQPYVLQNFDRRYSGAVPAREALASSLNVPAVHALQFAGLPAVHQLAGRMGLTTLQDVRYYGPAFTLGGADVRLIDLVYAYSVLANLGEQRGMPSLEAPPVVRRPLDPTPILRIEDANGRVIWEYQARSERVASAPHAYLVTDVLADDGARQRTFGRGSLLNLPGGRPAAVKTGLSESAQDAWTVGYTPQLVVGVWVGHKDNRPMPGATSVAVASPIWRRFLAAALEGEPVLPFEPPDGIEVIEVCRATGQPPAPGRRCSPLVRELFVRGQPPAAPLALVAPTPTPRPAAAPSGHEERAAPGARSSPGQRASASPGRP